MREDVKDECGAEVKADGGRRFRVRMCKGGTQI